MSPSRSMIRLAAAAGTALTLNLAGCGEEPYEPETAPPKGMTVAQWADKSLAKVNSIPEPPHTLTRRENTQCMTAANATNAWGEELMMQTPTVAMAMITNPGSDAKAAAQAHQQSLSKLATASLTLGRKCAGPVAGQ